jgi:hypothetical protein
MAQDNPSVSELLETVHEFIADVSEKLDGQDKYFALCSMFLLEIVQRELKDWQPSITDDDKRLMSLLDEKSSSTEVIEQLSEKIKQGGFDDRMDELLGVLLKHVEAKVKVTKPSYLG